MSFATASASLSDLADRRAAAAPGAPCLADSAAVLSNADVLDHANVAAMCAMAADALRVTAADHSLLILPLFHVNGIVVGSLTPLLAGGRVTIADRFDPSTFFSVVERVRPTYFSAVPTIYAMLSALPDDVVPDTSSLRVAICGAAPMPAELIGRFETRFGVPIVEGYGLSEGSCASTVNP